jgi:cold shock CspA family protein
MKATVSFWKAEEGWGELIVTDRKKCFGHFSVIEQSGGYRSLNAGDLVEVEWTAASQDEYDHVAVLIQPL